MRKKRRAVIRVVRPVKFVVPTEHVQRPVPVMPIAVMERVKMACVLHRHLVPAVMIVKTDGHVWMEHVQAVEAVAAVRVQAVQTPVRAVKMKPVVTDVVSVRRVSGIMFLIQEYVPVFLPKEVGEHQPVRPGGFVPTDFLRDDMVLISERVAQIGIMYPPEDIGRSGVGWGQESTHTKPRVVQKMNTLVPHLQEWERLGVVPRMRSVAVIMHVGLRCVR